MSGLPIEAIGSGLARSLGKLLATTAATAVVLVAPLHLADMPAMANGPASETTHIKIANPGEVRKLQLTLNKSRTLRIGRPVSEALVASSDIADVVPLTDQSIYVVGKRIGLTRLTLLDAEKRLIGIVEIEVSFDIKGLREELERIVPGQNLRMTTANGRIILGGVMPDAMTLARVLAVTEQFTAGCEEQSQSAPKGPSAGGGAQPTIQLQITNPGQQKGSAGGGGGGGGDTPKCFVNSMTVRAPQQVLLEVRFVEAQRTAARDFGFAWDGKDTRFRGVSGLPALINPQNPLTGLPALIGGFPASNIPFGTFVARILDHGMTADVLIEALEKRGVVRRLAEPNLVTLSGDTANFLAGGEFPFPVAAERDRITIEFKKFGVGLAFTPTVLSDSQINLKIEPEVSDLDPTNTILVGNTRIPSLIVRRTNTTVELRDGQSFAIAGLLQTSHSKNTRELPWLSTVPVLGTMFRSASYEKNESDLVIIVTPRLVRPAKPGQQLATPLDQRLAANDKDYFLRGQLEVPKHFDAPFGHILDLNRPVAASKHEGTGHAGIK